jgi:hypothetical protein
MIWVPSTKVHARFVLSKHVCQKFFHADKTMGSRKSDRSSGDYGTAFIKKVGVKDARMGGMRDRYFFVKKV